MYHPLSGSDILPRHLLNHHFDSTPVEELVIFAMASATPALIHYHDHPSRCPHALAKVGSTIKAEKGKFRIYLDVHHYTPDEVSLKISDGFLIVEAKHEDKQDEHGFITRTFCRRFTIPDGVDINNFVYQRSLDGMLTIVAPIQGNPKLTMEKCIPIVQTENIKKHADQGQNIVPEYKAGRNKVQCQY